MGREEPNIKEALAIVGDSEAELLSGKYNPATQVCTRQTRVYCCQGPLPVCLKVTTGDPTGISSTSSTMLFHCYQYYTITNPWVCSGMVPCACQYGSWKPLLSILGNEPFHLKHCQIPTLFTAHKESGTKYRPF